VQSVRVTPAKTREGTDVELDDLRRRLYRAGATESDLQHYLDERAAIGPDDEAPEEPIEPLPRRRRSLVIAAGTVAVLAVAVAALAHQPGMAPRPAAMRSVTVNTRDGRTIAAPLGGLTGPTRTAVTIEGTATAAQRFEGVGDQIVPVELPGAEFGNQRAVVVLYSDHTSTIGWQALRATTRADGSSYPPIIARGRVATHLDYATPSTFSYAGAPPSQITVQAASGLHWTLLVAVATDSTSLLH